MPLLTPDFSEVTENKPVPPGVYNARLKDAEIRQSKAGSTYVNWKLELFGDETVNNRTVFHSTPISGKGAFRLKELYKAATGEDLSDKTQFDTDMLIAKEVTVTLIPGKDAQGNVRDFPDVKSVTAIKQ